MNSRQIDQLLRKNRFTKKIFLGVFASDKIPQKIKNFPACFVANTDPSGQRGEHWVAYWVKDGKNVERFCSLGSEPNENAMTFLQQFKNIGPMVFHMRKSLKHL
jgi:hypothetical protein